MAFYHRSVQGLGGVARTLGRVFDRVGIVLEGETAVVEKCEFCKSSMCDMHTFSFALL
jgi:hypothetical protein